MYTCTCMYVYIYVYIYVHLYLYQHLYLDLYLHRHMYIRKVERTERLSERETVCLCVCARDHLASGSGSRFKGRSARVTGF